MDFGELQLRPDPTPFEQIGGAQGVDALVELFYAEMDRASGARGIRALHTANLKPTKFVLKRYLCEWLGGPPLYSRERGHPRLRMRHLRFPIGEAERDAWLACMRTALSATIADPGLRDRLDVAFAGLADHMRNQTPAQK